MPVTPGETRTKRKIQREARTRVHSKGKYNTIAEAREAYVAAAMRKSGYWKTPHKGQ